MRKLADLGGRESAQAAYEARLAERASQLERERAQLGAAQAALKQEQERLQTAIKVNFYFTLVSSPPQQIWAAATRSCWGPTLFVLVQGDGSIRHCAPGPQGLLHCC